MKRRHGTTFISDPPPPAGIVLTTAKFGPIGLLRTALMARTLTGPFSAVVDRVVTDPWLRKFLDLECFVLSGMLAKDTICAGGVGSATAPLCLCGWVGAGPAVSA
jgi:hypothetical protein